MDLDGSEALMSKRVTFMNARNLALDQYTRSLRRLNARLALVVVGLIPLPAILLRARFEPLQMLIAVMAVATGVGIVYPVWWRSKHHPYRQDERERRTRLIAVICRVLAFASLVGFLVSWVAGSSLSAWMAVAFLIVGAAAFIVGFEVDERWKRILRRRAAQLAGDP
jgi:hypothetical protein